MVFVIAAVVLIVGLVALCAHADRKADEASDIDKDDSVEGYY